MGAFSNDRRKNNGYRLAHKRFMLDLPADWADRSVYRFEGPLEDGIQQHIAVTIAHDLDITDLEAYAGLQIKALEKELQGYHELKRGPLALGNGLAAFELVYQWCPAETVQLLQRQVWALRNRTGYTLVATFSPNTWKTLGAQVDRIIRSFTIPAPE